MIASARRLARQATLAGMARYAIPSDKAFGVPVGRIRDLAKKLRRERTPEERHALALALWSDKSEWYEARMLAVFVDEPSMVTRQQMDAWCRDFDSWAICDTACFHLFDRTTHALAMVERWGKRKSEFVRRAAFALLASAALHDKNAPDEVFLKCLPLIERSAADKRNFVKKAVSWALRGIGKRSAALRSRSCSLARQLAESKDAGERWVGRDALRDLTR